MAAAVAQGVMATTLDVDVWIDLQPRQYMRIQNLAHKLGATIAANTVVYLIRDGTPVNFVYEVHGIGNFSREHRRIVWTRLHGHDVPVLSLERILKSKQAIGRDKDKLHILLIKEYLRCQREVDHPSRRNP
jgi:hypothetical protein